MGRCHVRCRKCRTRQALPRSPSQYQTPPRCRSCGAEALVADRWMNTRNTKKMTCHSDCYPFPHRRGSLGCKFTEAGEYRHGKLSLLPGIALPF